MLFFRLTCQKAQVCLVLLLLLFFSVNLSAQGRAHNTGQSLPLWELGVAAGYVSIPYYRGSASSRDAVVPMPLAIYRGDNEVKKAQNPRLFSPSFAVGLPVPEGGQTGVRQNMPRLDATLEFGPKLTAILWEKPGWSLSLSAPLRAVTSISSRQVDLQGWVFAPYLHYVATNKGKNGWTLNVALGPQYGTKRFHQYYYAVSENYVTSERVAYNARSGYGGSRITVYAQKTFSRLWLSALMRYDELSGASFIDSPLIEKNTALFGGFVIGWVFAKSPQQVFLAK